MKRVRYCDECRRDHEVRIQEQPATYMFGDEPFEIIEQYAVCTVCGNRVTDEELDTKTMQKVEKLYEIKHSFNPEALKEIRLSFDLPQTLFAKLLSMGIATVKRYETGAVAPNSSQLGIYKMLKTNSRYVKQLFDQSKTNFTAEELQTVQGKLSPFLEEEKISESSYKVLESAYHPHERSVDTGFSSFQAEKLFQMTLFFSIQGVLKTKLMKLLWYADFLHYKRWNTAISGTPYWHKQFGPVPKHHDLVLGFLEGMNLISVEEEETQEGYTKITITSKDRFSSDIFSQEEMDTLRYINEYFKLYRSRDITGFSHREAGWKETTEEQIIPYVYAGQLQLS